MHIIYEGIDNIGKSTQIELMKTFLTNSTNKSTHVLHYSYFKGLNNCDHYKYSVRLYDDMLNAVDKINDINIIFDRSHIGEVVYSPMYRNYSGEYVYELENKYDLSNLYLVTLITSDIESIINRDDNNSLSKNSIDLIRDEINNFVKATNKSNIKNKLILDVSNLSINNIFEKIKDFICN